MGFVPWETVEGVSVESSFKREHYRHSLVDELGRITTERVYQG